MSHDRRTIAVSLAIVLFAAACGGGSAATIAPGSTTAPATQEPALTEAASTPAPATQAPAPTGTAAAPDVSLVPGTAPELEAMLPSTVKGVAFTKTSFGGGTLPATLPIDSGEFGTFLKDNGKTLADLSLAMATPTDASKAGTFIMAFQVKGLDASKLAELLGGGSSGGLQTVTVGGKQVEQTAAGGMGLTLYVKGDVVFYVIALGDASLTEAIIAALP
jgi:hypothetical protein